tara:strand:+ start:25790 stop:27199 length:1410 start_codon:yes stop_codon:yes gene_type:complete
LLTILGINLSETAVEIDITSLVFDVKEAIKHYQSDDNVTVHPFDIKETLVEIRDLDEEVYLSTLKSIPNVLLAEVIAEFPSHLQEEASELLGVKKLAKITTEMDTDDAADFLQNISERDEKKAESVLGIINKEDQEIIRSLISYDDDVAGAYMQSELFSVSEDELVGASINRLRKMKADGDIESLSQVFVTKKSQEYICSIGLEELVLLDPDNAFKDIINRSDIRRIEFSCHHQDDIRDVVEKVSDYNLGVIPVIDDNNKLIGRITSDDIYDLIETQATEEMFSMAGLNADVEQSDDIIQAAKNRALWLGVNLLTAIAASAIISLFDSTIEKFVSLAILMPIVASMGGNAGTQSLTVTVRQLSIGEIELDDAIDTIKKEVTLSLINGLLFALVIGVIAYFWFQIPYLGIVIGLSTIINLFIAGFAGALIPLALDKLDIDPAIASTVLLTTITDIIGFFSFLGLARLLMF